MVVFHFPCWPLADYSAATLSEMHRICKSRLDKFSREQLAVDGLLMVFKRIVDDNRRGSAITRRLDLRLTCKGDRPEAICAEPEFVPNEFAGLEAQIPMIGREIYSKYAGTAVRKRLGESRSPSLFAASISAESESKSPRPIRIFRS